MVRVNCNGKVGHVECSGIGTGVEEVISALVVSCTVPLNHFPSTLEWTVE